MSKAKIRNCKSLCIQANNDSHRELKLRSIFANDYIIFYMRIDHIHIYPKNK